MRKNTILVLLIAVLAGFTSANGQEKRNLPLLGVSGPQTIPPSLQKWPNVTLNLLLVDQVNGSTALADPSVLEVFEDHTVQTIQSIAGPGTPVSLCLLIDHSGSLFSFRSEVDDAAVSLITNLPPDSEAMVAVFEGESVLTLPFTAAAGFDRNMLKYPALRAGSALFNSLVATERYFERYARYKRKALVLITDGGENGSDFTLNETTRLMQIPDGPLVFALQIPREEIGGEGRHNAKTLDKLTKAVGGIVFAADGKRDIVPSAGKISQAIGHQYALSYVSTQTAPDEHVRRLEVRVSRRGIDIQAAPGYYPPTP